MASRVVESHSLTRCLWPATIFRLVGPVYGKYTALWDGAPASENEVIRTGKSNATHLVFPEHLKYDQTQKAPYAAMFDRLRAFLSTPDTLLISTGFSFADAHVAARVDEGLAGNPAASVFAFQFKNLDQEGAACDLAQRRPNFSVYAKDKAVVNGIAGPWELPAELPSKDWGPIRATYWGVQNPGEPPQFLLGAIEFVRAFLCGVAVCPSFCGAGSACQYCRAYRYAVMSAPTLLGHVGAVAGASISVRQFEGVASGISIIGGRSYRVGQVGSFVKIPQGYHDLYGIVSEVGANATPETLKDIAARGERWMTVQLVGEIIEATFERGISQYPTINDEVHLVTEEDLGKIYGTADSGQVMIGRLAGAESIPVKLDLERLVTRHCAVLGSTGSGKSTTVASLLRSIAGKIGEKPDFPSTRILLLDIHGEYATALKSVAEVFRVTPLEGESQLFVPYWAIETGELFSFLMGRLEDKAFTAILDKILAAKLEMAKTGAFDGIDVNSLMADTPLPFSLKQLWLDLIDPEVKTWANQERTTPALESKGDAEKLIAPKYKAAGAGGTLSAHQYGWRPFHKTPARPDAIPAFGQTIRFHAPSR